MKGGPKRGLVISEPSRREKGGESNLFERGPGRLLNLLYQNVKLGDSREEEPQAKKTSAGERVQIASGRKTVSFPIGMRKGRGQGGSEEQSKAGLFRQLYGGNEG